MTPSSSNWEALNSPTVYVTGVPGAAKSSVRRELQRRGHVASGADEDGLGAFFREDGSEIDPEDVVDSAEWRGEHVWRLVPSRLTEVAEQLDASRVFVCGSVANEADVWHHFARGASSASMRPLRWSWLSIESSQRPKRSEKDDLPRLSGSASGVGQGSVE